MIIDEAQAKRVEEVSRSSRTSFWGMPVSSTGMLFVFLFPVGLVRADPLQ